MGERYFGAGSAPIVAEEIAIFVFSVGKLETRSRGYEGALEVEKDHSFVRQSVNN